MFTREQYMAAPLAERRAAHRKYYGQFVTPAIKALVLIRIGKDRIVASQDPHFNDIPLNEWDNLAVLHQSSLAIPEENGKRYWSLGGGVCILKEAASQIREEALGYSFDMTEGSRAGIVLHSGGSGWPHE